MTEVERIIKKGIISEDFLKEETKCDFFIDALRKKLWAIELDLLIEFDRFCKMNQLKYYLAFGTLLGAVRHKGFIPWDDDLDVIMFRSDYNKLLEIASFDYPYFFQTPYTDRGKYFYSYAKLRNDNTTFVGQNFSYQGFHAGINIDIYPVDNWINHEAEKLDERIKYLNLENSTYMRRTNPNLDENNKLRVKNWSGKDPLQAYEEIQRLSTQYNDIETQDCGMLVDTTVDYKKRVFPKEFFKETVYLDYEGHRFPVPYKYKEVLAIRYGDYMKYPPVNERGTWHKDLIIDPDTPYSIRLKHI